MKTADDILQEIENRENHPFFANEKRRKVTIEAMESFASQSVEAERKRIHDNIEDKIYKAIHCLTDDDGCDYPDTNLVKRANSHLNEALKIINTRLSTVEIISDILKKEVFFRDECIYVYCPQPEMCESYCQLPKEDKIHESNP